MAIAARPAGFAFMNQNVVKHWVYEITENENTLQKRPSKRILNLKIEDVRSKIY